MLARRPTISRKSPAANDADVGVLNPTTPSRWFRRTIISLYILVIRRVLLVSAVQNDMQAARMRGRMRAVPRVTYGGTTGGCGVQVADGVKRFVQQL